MDKRFQSLSLNDLEFKARELCDEGKLNEAEDYYLELIRRQPNWEDGLPDYELGIVYEEQGKYNSAKAHYVSALGYRPYDEMFWQSLVMLQYHLNEYEECFESICAVLEMYPENYDEIFHSYLLKYGKAKKMSQSDLESKVRERVNGFVLRNS